MSVIERARVVVVGGGVVGGAILHELAGNGIAGILVEAEPDLCEGTSKANSAIVHTGFDSKPGTVESRMLRRAAELWPETIEVLEVPFLAVGALMLARTREDASRLEVEVASNAAALGVTTELVDAAVVRDLAPYLAEDVVAALSIPDESVVDPFWLTRAFVEAAVAGGAEVRLGRRVVGLEVRTDEIAVRLDDGTTLLAEQVIDAAGIRADEVARLAGDESFTLSPRVGQFLVSEETFGVDRIVLPIPGPLGKGMLVTPIVFGGLLLGPTALDMSDKDDRSVDPASRERILDATRAMVPALREAVPVRQFAGLRHVSSTGDFVVRPSAVSDRLYLAAGIRSTGISTSPAVAEAVVADVMDRRRWRRPPIRRRLAPPPSGLPDEPGEIICLCRSISRGEVAAACRRAIAPTTLDGVKRRGGATFGDCQGNLCALGVAGIVAAERGIPVADVEKHRRGSWLWERANDATATDGRVGATARVAPRGRAGTLRALDVVVVGAGHAGAAAAAELSRAGLAVAVLERADDAGRDARPSAAAEVVLGATVVGLSPAADDGWIVLAQTAAGSIERSARDVVVATGAYVQPREQRAIAGPRPAGIMTADLAERLLDAGLRPGRRVAMVGGPSRAADLGRRMEQAGSAVVRLAAEPVEVRGDTGDARLAGVRVGDRWFDVDTLVFADRLVPQAFVLRGLGLLDGRPGTPAPVDDDGRLPAAGLWAVGCCVEPSHDHARCAAAGRALGKRLSEASSSHGAPAVTAR